VIDEREDNTESSISIQTTNQINHPPATLTKYCIGCDHEFSHRSAFLRHIRRIHHGIYPTQPNKNKSEEEEEEVSKIEKS
jgi:hypothetical protein